MPSTIRSRVSQVDVIDLTLEDSDDSTPPPLTRSVQRSFTPQWRSGSNTAAPEHGLPLDETARSSAKWQSDISNRLLPNASELIKISTKADRSSPSRIMHPQQESIKLHNISMYVTNNAKRRRVDLMPLARQEESELNLHVTEILPSPKAEVLLGAATRAQTSSLAARSGLEEGLESTRLATNKDTVGESLKLALRQQVFPHINQCLSHYRRSIDSTTKKQIGKKAAWEICSKDFMNNLMSNNGRLSSDFEDKIAVMAQSLVDKFTEEALRKSKTFKNYSAVANDPSQKDAQIGTAPNEDVSKDKSRAEAARAPAAAQVEAVRATAAQVEVTKSKLDKAAKARKTAKMGAVMEAPWDSREIRVVRTKMVAENNENKTVGNASDSVPVRLANRNKAWENWKETSLKRSRSFHKTGSSKQVPISRSDPVPVICLCTSSSSNDEDGLPHKSKSSLSTSSAVLSKNDGNHGEKFVASLPDGRKGSLRSAAGFISKFPTPRSVQKDLSVNSTRPVYSTKTRERINATRLSNEQISSVQSIAQTQELENLRLAIIDDRVSRPYLALQDRQDVLRGLEIAGSSDGSQTTLSAAEISLLQRSIIHVDFCPEEIETLIQPLETLSGRKTYFGIRNSNAHIKCLVSACQSLGYPLAKITSTVHEYIKTQRIGGRTNKAVGAFLDDVASGLISSQAQVTRIQLTRASSHNTRETLDPISSALRERETWGRHCDPRSRASPKAQILCHIEDKLTRQAEWTDCSGDIASIAWVDGDRYFCGATAHSDEHNMQYNKSGNLLVGSISQEIMRSVAGHQVVRPIATKGENATESMRQSQDPWLYSSVTSTIYSHHINKCFTGSYDQTVKVWNINVDGSSMDLCGTWPHSGNVNFVVASSNHSLIATAADVCEDAVRVYHFNPDDINGSVYTCYEPTVQERNSNDTWAYFPATMQWGLSPTVSQLLLVGYSPRSFDCCDGDIPEDKANTGELCLWNVKSRSRVSISSSKTQNVFEVVWHPSHPIFVAATSPAGEFESCVKTQLRLFGQMQSGAFLQIKTLDCPALDINEITVRPHSSIHCYVTASCTDGNSYIWDSALSDKPIHILSHGDSIDDQVYGSSREECDNGVKFAAWGKCSNRFYTGSSDGVVKIWNVRAPPGEAFLRDLITLSGGVSTGKFSPDFRQLVIGDSTGKIHLFSSRGSEVYSRKSAFIQKPVKPHAPLPPPLVDEDDQDIPPEQTGPEIGRQYLDRQQIIIHPDEYVGAIQGPNYKQTGHFYNANIYKDEQGRDAVGWSKEELEERRQQRVTHQDIRFPRLPSVRSSSWDLHRNNLALDLHLSVLPQATITQLMDEGVDLRFQDENKFRFELERWLQRPKKLEVGSLVRKQCRDVKYASDEFDDNDEKLGLEEHEIRDLQKLHKIIHEGLEMHRGLKDLF